MRLGETFYLKNIFNRTMTVVLLSCIATIVFLVPKVTKAEETAETLITDYEPEINEVITNDFKHPGIGLTKDILEDMREQVRAEKEPWNSYFNRMILSDTASKTVSSSNQSGEDPTKPDSDAFNSQGFQSRFIDDALKAYTQSIMYVITGDEVYRENAMHIIRIWSQMDPEKYEYYNDAHIHSGIPLFRMVSAAEILRYTSTQNSDLEWTDQDTEDFTNNLINPTINTFQYSNHHFMNQHLYPLIGAMSGYIFTDNEDRYDEGVEWFTVNESAEDQGQNGSIKQLFRWVDTDIETGEEVDSPRVQLAEMGRDQAHATGDVINVEYLSRMLSAQETKVDPVEGTVSTADDAVNTYNFLDNRLLEGADYFAQYMLGYDTPWTPLAAHTDLDGNPTIIYKQIASGYRGRINGEAYGLYYYYKYNEGLNMEEEAPYLTEMFNKRHYFWWESPDGGGDYWLYIPTEAEDEGENDLPKESEDPDLIELEQRYTSFDEHSETVQEDDISFVQANATEEGTKIAIVGSATGAKTLGFKIRTNGTAEMNINLGTEAKLTLPDTKGEWKYVTYDLSDFQGFGDLVYLTIKGRTDTKVDIDHINMEADEQLTPLTFNSGDAPLNLFGYSGADLVIDFDFSATSENESDSISYQIDHKPEGAEFDADTGAFTWKPTESGTYNFVVSATDGTTVTAKNVQIVVSEDRASAVDAVIEGYDSDTKYTEDTLTAYEQAYDDAMDAISSASDEVFYEKLEELNKTVENLEEMTPLLDDGSMDYSHMFESSTFGDQLMNLLDGMPDTFAGYYLADNLTFYMDLGPNFKVSADSFQMQVRSSFPERIGGVAVFGSNDKENWTRLTPDTTTVSEDMQTLEVADDLKNEPFRFLKIQMIDPPGGNPMLELSELRIFGERHEVVNKLSSVSIFSDQSQQNRITLGDTVKLSFESTEAIDDVDVTIQGQTATVTSDDQKKWTAEAIMDDESTPGNVHFRINYKTKDGVDAEETLFTTDDSLLFLADESDLINNIVDATDITDSSERSPEDARETARALFDGDSGTITDYRVDGSGYGGWVAFDFKEGGYAKLTSVELLARQDGYADRIGGAVIQGSNDGESWTTLSNEAAPTRHWQTLEINETDDEYRYIRIYNGNNWFGNMSEVRFHGESFVEDFVLIEDVSLQSDNSYDPSVALPGDTVTLTFKTESKLKEPRVSFGDEVIEVVTDDHQNWLAEYTVDDDDIGGDIGFNINAENAPTVTKTTDNTSVLVIDSLEEALEKADNLESEKYTRLSFYQFNNQVEFVKEHVSDPDYSDTELAIMLYEAKSILAHKPYSIYSFEGNANSSDGLLNGTITGTPTYKEGKVGEAIQLNGDDSYITLPENHPLSQFDEMTIATWVKWEGGSDWQRIFDFGNNEDQNLFLTPSSDASTLRFAIKNGGEEEMLETSSLPENEWVHVAVTLGNDTGTLYVNGEEAATSDINIKPSDFQPSENFIGKSMYPDPLFNGMIDEFSIFNYVMEKDEIMDVYNNKLVTVDTTLLDSLLGDANEALEEGDYTGDSEKQLQEAIDKAEAVYEEDLTQEAVDDATEVLDEALKNLEEQNDISEWNPDKAYLGGDKVIYDDKHYEALWWTQGETPGESTVWSQMVDQGDEWVPNNIYDTGDQVLYKGSLYEAQWWTQGETPDKSQVWVLVDVSN